MNRWKNLSIRAKLVIPFLTMSLVVLLCNIFLYSNINTMINELDSVYQSNSNMNELSDALTEVQENLTKFLNNKSSETLEAYYAGVQELNQLMETLNTDIYGDDVSMMERNIYNMTTEYLEITDQAIDSKRGRNIENYRTQYQEASERYDIIQPYIAQLNINHFKINSANYEILVEYMGFFKTMSILILIGVCISTIIVVLILTQNIISPLHKLAKVADEVAAGNLEVEHLEVQSQDEIGIVTNAFNHMMDSIDEYIRRVKVNAETENIMKEKELIMQGHLKDAQLKYLQAQINPHFLFNTLNAGAQLAMLEGADRTCTFVENMADFFRYNVKKINEDSTIEEELRLVDNYLYILNVRFGGEIHYSSEVEEQWLGTRVPSMILQPIVENAVNYGIRGIDWEGHIVLKVYEHDSYICISIFDNGVGISEEAVYDILYGEDRETDLAKNSTGIGMVNVISRLQVYYNHEQVMRIIAKGENQGTEVIIYIPKLQEA